MSLEEFAKKFNVKKIDFVKSAKGYLCAFVGDQLLVGAKSKVVSDLPIFVLPHKDHIDTWVFTNNGGEVVFTKTFGE